MAAPRTAIAALAALLCVALPLRGAEPVRYTLSFPEPEQRWMQVEVLFTGVEADPLEVRMSRSSPGRYALHEFAKNVFDVEVSRGHGGEAVLSRPDPHGWSVAGHDGTVRFRYKVFGDRVDGTFLGIDSTHAHVNAPAALVWARGFESRPALVEISLPGDSGWRVATQLQATEHPLVFRAPNLPYLLDSPVELSAFELASVSLAASVGDDGTEAGPSRELRIALHHRGNRAQLEAFASDIERIAMEQRAIFGELPDFDGGSYTFIADYLPWAVADGMEHRNSTVLTSAGGLDDASQRLGLVTTAAHELFHAWNVERIRPASLEPFDFEDANVSGELWLAEGFSSYYAALVLRRAGLATLDETLSGFAEWLNTVTLAPGRQLRSAEEMSRLAPFVDAAAWVDATSWSNTYVSYYTWGAALGLGLDLELRARSDGAVTLDDLMRALWQGHGRADDAAPGIVPRPYTTADVERLLGAVARDPAFAADFLDRYVRGRELPDYAALLARAGLSLRPKRAAHAWLGELLLEFGGGARVAGPVPRASPAHRAGLAQDDRIVTIGGQAVETRAELDSFLERRRPGDATAVTFLRRGAMESRTLILGSDPTLELVALEGQGAEPTPAQRSFREAWLGSRARASR